MSIREGTYTKWGTVFGGIGAVIAIASFVLVKPDVVVNLFGDPRPSSTSVEGQETIDHTAARGTSIAPSIPSTSTQVGAGATNGTTTTASTGASIATTALAYDNRILAQPGGSSYYVESGRKHSIGHSEVANCIAVRRGAGAPISVTNAVLARYADSDAAYCPYEFEAGLKFVTEEGSGGWVWFVETDGTLRHAGSLCVSDPYTTQWKQFRVWQVPAGETVGHKISPPYFASAVACDTYPKIIVP